MVEIYEIETVEVCSCENLIALSSGDGSLSETMIKASKWTFFSNHAHVLVSLARDGDRPLREVALAVGITERAVQRIIADLESDGYILREKVGRQNRYLIQRDKAFRHEIESDRTIGEMLEIFSA